METFSAVVVFVAEYEIGAIDPQFPRLCQLGATTWATGTKHIF